MGKLGDGRTRRRLRLPALLVVAVVLGLFAALFYTRLNAQSESGKVFCLFQGSWTSVAPLPRQAAGLAAAFGNQIWVSTADGVQRFDGKQWTRYPEALKTKAPVALAANSGAVWVLDQYGNLARFDGRRWSVNSLAGKLPGVIWGPRGLEHPAMEVANDGSLWILWDGLWHSNPAGWSEVRLDGNEVIAARLVGHDETHVWLARDGELQAVTAAGAIETRLRPDAAGIPGAAVLKLVPSAGAVWVAAASGLAVYDGSAWRAAGMPPGTRGILDIATAGSGGLWVIGDQAPGLVPRLKLALPVVGFSSAALSLLAYVAYSLLRLRQERLAHSSGLGPDPRNYFATRWTSEALRKGDYSGALQTLHRVALGFPNRHILMLQGTVLSLAGHFEEAEQCCRRAVGKSLEAGGVSGIRPLALDRLASVLMDLKRFEEAHQLLEEALHRDPHFAPAQSDLAELLLMEGKEPQRALELIDGVLAGSPSAAYEGPGRDLRSEATALRAWALAACDRKAAAEAAIRSALYGGDQKFRPVVAANYWRIGMALEALHDHNAAVTHFHAAINVDHDGKYGKRAQQQLNSVSSATV